LNVPVERRSTPAARPCAWRRRQEVFGRELGTAALLVLLVLGCAGDQEIELPAPLYGQLTIDYPIELWDQDIEGRTLLRVRVTELGAVDSVEVLQSSGQGAFDAAAIAGARELRFNPARRNGKRIEVWAQVPVQFSKRPHPPE
jgi:TonB family protein